MERTTVIRNTLISLAVGAWIFALLSLGSFHSTDWPSHEIYPYPAMQNLCGTVGAFFAYYAFLTLGQGVFPVLLFLGIVLAMKCFSGRVTDLWLRSAGLVLLAVAFATAVHHLTPSSRTGFPEGQGGIVGIGASSFLQSHFSVWGTRLILLTSFLIGLLLAADDLVVRAPSFVGGVVQGVRENTPQLRIPRIPKFALPKMPALPTFRRTGGESSTNVIKPKAPARRVTTDDIGTDDTTTSAILGRENDQGKSGRIPAGKALDQEIELTYDDDELPTSAASQEEAHRDDADPAPAEAAVIPPVEEQKVAEPLKPEIQIKKDIVVRLPSMLKPRQVSPPPATKELGEYNLPDWSVLAEAENGFAEAQEKFVREQAAILEQALREFNIDASVVEIDTGPVITMYEIALAAGIKVSAITALENDIQRSLKAETIRIVAPVPGKNTVGIEVPNEQKEKVRLKELMALAPEAMAKDFVIPLFLGKDASGEPLIADLTKMPHCLIAGTTGSGKSVCINTIIMSIMYLQRPDFVKLILVDPKVVEMAPFRDIPHLMAPVINDSLKATSVLEWACGKMDERYEFLSEAGVRNIKDYNKMSREELIERFNPGTPEEEAKIPKQLPYIVIIIDELADLMMTSGKEVESFIVRIAQKARAVGIHLVLATQRPQANVVTGLIKSNMPSRIAFRVASRMDSRIVLDQNGADRLLGQGDMLFLPPGASKPIRSQGTFIDDKEIRDSVKLVKSLAEAQYEPELVQIKANPGDMGDMEKDELFDDAVRVVLETRRGSVSLLQRRLTIGYSRASRLIEQMAAAGLVGEYKGSQAREATITLDEWEAMQSQQSADAADGMTV